ncbi:hypothetical protein [Kribbella steppae]|uniref:hypothetical protein n=1 Tax=Kribbella steppae TaxID=2512223 RepID=UPI00104821B3|nr:hypothetical protein [Kribbella steppae]
MSKELGPGHAEVSGQPRSDELNRPVCDEVLVETGVVVDSETSRHQADPVVVGAEKMRASHRQLTPDVTADKPNRSIGGQLRAEDSVAGDLQAVGDEGVASGISAEQRRIAHSQLGTDAGADQSHRSRRGESIRHAHLAIDPHTVRGQADPVGVGAGQLRTVEHKIASDVAARQPNGAHRAESLIQVDAVGDPQTVADQTGAVVASAFQSRPMQAQVPSHQASTQQQSSAERAPIQLEAPQPRLLGNDVVHESATRKSQGEVNDRSG